MFAYTENSPVMNTDPLGYGYCFASAGITSDGMNCVGGGGGGGGWGSSYHQTDLGRAMVLVGSFDSDSHFNTAFADSIATIGGFWGNVIRNIILPNIQSGANSLDNMLKGLNYLTSVLQFISAYYYYRDNAINHTIRDLALGIEFLIIFGLDALVALGSKMAMTTSLATGPGAIPISFFIAVTATTLNYFLENKSRDILVVLGKNV